MEKRSHGIVLVPSIVTLVAILACRFPALRAMRIEPAVALKDEYEPAAKPPIREPHKRSQPVKARSE